MTFEMKTVNVKKEDAQKTIDLYSRFAWEMKESYDVTTVAFDNKAASQEKYTSIVFERNVDIPNYERICELEKQYISISKELPEGKYDSLKTFAKYFNKDYRNNAEKTAMGVLIALLMVAALFAISKEIIFVILLIALAATFIFNSSLKEKAFEENITNSESNVCKAYRKYVGCSFAIDKINRELCTLC